MSAQEQALIADVARNPTSLFALDSSNKKSLETLEATLSVKQNAAAKARGLTPPTATEIKHRPVK